MVSIYFQNNKLIEDPIKLKSFYQFFYNKVSYVRQMSNKLIVTYKGNVSTNMKKINFVDFYRRIPHFQNQNTFLTEICIIQTPTN